MASIDKSETSTPADEVSRLHNLIEQARIKLTPHGGDQDPARHPLALATIEQTRTTVQLPRLSAIFPAFSSGRNAGESGYPTPGPTPAGATSSSHAGTPRPYASPHVSPESHALSTFTPGIRHGFAFHRKCTRFAFIAYDEKQFDQLMADFEASVAENRSLPEVKDCEIYSVCVMASTFNRMEIPAAASDVFYKAAFERIGPWVHDQPLVAMKCCGLLGLANIFLKATISLLYFDLALTLAHGVWRESRTGVLDMNRADHAEFYQTWRSLVFGRAWLQSTIGACTSDDLLWLPPITLTAEDGAEMAAAKRASLLIPVEISRVTVIAAKAMRVLSACSTPSDLLPAVRDILDQVSTWYDGLPLCVQASELSKTPWDESKVCLGYVHFGHLGAITLIFRRTLSMYAPKIGGHKNLQVAERDQLAAILRDGIVSAKQSSRLLYLFLNQKVTIRHCWALAYVAFVSVAILLYCVSQMQLHAWPEDDWRPYLDLVDNGMEVLANCQELDPVAGALRDSLSQYLQFLRLYAPAPKKRKRDPPSNARFVHQKPSELPREEHAGQDLVDLLLSVPSGRAGPVQTSMDLLKLVCQPFNDGEKPKPSPAAGYRIPLVLGSVQHDPPEEKKVPLQATEAWMPFGWKQRSSAVAYTRKSTNIGITLAQEKTLKAGV